MRDRCSGFTLIELLIVCAIISILSSIATTNYLEAQTRAKVSRTKADMATMATGLECYAIDDNHYPVRHDFWEIESHYDEMPVLCTPKDWFSCYPKHTEKVFDPDHGERELPVGLHVLTTPIGYLSSLPPDLFNEPARALMHGTIHFDAKRYQGNHGGSDCIEYFDEIQLTRWLNHTMILQKAPTTCGRKMGYALISVGPDQHFGLHVPDAMEGNPFGYPPETRLTWNTDRHFYDPTNGTISAGNIYRFSGGLKQEDLICPDDCGCK